MPQSLASIYIHLVFSTKHREPLINAPFDAGLHSYMAGILQGIRCPAITIGGRPDHVHVLFSLARTASVSGVVEELKKDSSKWMKEQHPMLGGFYWQAGYGAFSIGQSGLDETRKYIENQAEHHKARSF